MNNAFELVAPADVIVVNSDCIVTEGWFEAMSNAASANTLVATVSVFTNHGTILSLPYRNDPQPSLPQDLDLETVGREIRSRSLRIRPRIPTVVGHCFYVKRSALELAGPFDIAFSPGYGEEVDFSQRCTLHGLVHVVADDVFVLHKGSASFSVNGSPNPVKELHDRMIAVRYPYFYDWVDHFAEATTSPFARSFGVAEQALRGLRISIDARCLTPILTGTQVHTLEVIAALSRESKTDLRVIIPHDLGDYAKTVLSSLPNVALLPTADVNDTTGRSDVVHRPYQVSSHDDIAFLKKLGHRILITQQDLIAYLNPGYFKTFDSWIDHRQFTRHALAVADRVVFFSMSSAEEAIAEELVERDRTDVAYIGTNHTLDELTVDEIPPKAIARLGERPFLLCLGADFAHKNRTFALRVLKVLREQHDWHGALIFAGPHVTVGSSASDEASFLALHPDFEDVVVDAAAVSEGNKRWLLRHATLMLYPTVHEGFGLVPFEAAEAGLVCAFASQTAIAELLPSSLALIEPWDPVATALRIAPYLESEELRREHVAAVRLAAAPLTWRRTAHQLMDIYSTATQARVSESRKLADDLTKVHRDRLHLKHELEQVRDKYAQLEVGYRSLRGKFDKTAEGLVGPDGVIPHDLRRPLLAIGTRRVLRVPFFGLLRLAYRMGYRLRHGGRGPDRGAAR